MIAGAALVGVLLSPAVAAAQGTGYGQAVLPDQPPGFDQQGGGAEAGNQPPNLVLAGTWSGDLPGGPGHDQTLHEIYQFTPNGHFAALVDGMAGGVALHIWGSYLTSRVGPNQIRIQSQTDSWAPQQLCRPRPGATPACQPLAMPRQAVAVATFVAADTIEVSSGEAGSGDVSAGDGGDGRGSMGAEQGIIQHRVANAAPLGGSRSPLAMLPAGPGGFAASALPMIPLLPPPPAKVPASP